MNDLNSVLIEGRALRSAEWVDENRSMMRISSVRYEPGNPTKSKDVWVDVYCSGNLAGRCVDLMREGRRMRVVGRIDMEENDLIVVAEHVEFCPFRNESGRAEIRG